MKVIRHPKSGESKIPRRTKATNAHEVQTMKHTHPKKKEEAAPKKTKTPISNVHILEKYVKSKELYVNISRFVSAMSELDAEYLDKHETSIENVLDNLFPAARINNLMKHIERVTTFIENTRSVYNRVQSENETFCVLAGLDFAAPKSSWFEAKIRQIPNKETYALGVRDAENKKWYQFSIPADVMHRQLGHCLATRWDSVLESCYSIRSADFHVSVREALKAQSFLSRIAKHVGGSILTNEPKIGDRLVIPWSVCANTDYSKFQVSKHIELDIGAGCIRTHTEKEHLEAEDGKGSWSRTVEHKVFTGNYNEDRATAVWEVVSTHMGGGGTGHGSHDIYPNGLCVQCKRDIEGGATEHLRFYVTGCFTNQIPIESIVILD